MDAPAPSWRSVDLGAVGAFEVRRPTLRDVTAAQGGDPAWWHACVRRDGTVLTHDECLDLDVEVANALATEVMKPREHPTQPPKGGFGESCRPLTPKRRSRRN